MADFLRKMNKIPGSFEVEIPRCYKGLQDSIGGTLVLSRQGYVYSAPSKTVTWLKFLGLALSLPIKALACKCAQVANACFGQMTPPKGAHDLDHMGLLSAIAWRGVIGSTSLMDTVEAYALAEMRYNGGQDVLLELPRSVRFSKGFYTARCMQPLFHRDQYEASSSKISDRIRSYDKTEKELTEALAQKQQSKKEETCWTRSVMQYFSTQPHRQKSIEQIRSELDFVIKEKAHLEKLLKTSERCEKYAAQAIFSQQCCPHVKEQFVETQAEVRCCGEVCYKQQRVCGLLYKIDCCATRCWALNCLFCVCCIWPEGCHACIL